MFGYSDKKAIIKQFWHFSQVQWKEEKYSFNSATAFNNVDKYVKNWINSSHKMSFNKWNMDLEYKSTMWIIFKVHLKYFKNYNTVLIYDIYMCMYIHKNTNYNDGKIKAS